MANGVTRNDSLPQVLHSDAYFARAEKLIPAGTQTLAKGPGQYVRGVAPKYIQRGRGARVWDVDGNEFLDLTMGVGPLILGYAHPAVDDAIRRQLEDGITFSLMHPLEVEVAERIASFVPCAEAVRFSKTGAEATSAAVRLSRAFTARNKVLACGYHGWHDWYIAVTDRNAGIPSAVADLTWTIPYNDLEAACAAIDDETACVILEPVTFEAPAPGFLEGLREACHRHGALLVFDEMWTGFRVARGGAQELFRVLPDLACFSKAVANGMPLSVLTGRRDVMALLEHDVFFFTTFGGEALSLAAASATLDVLASEPVLTHIASLGRLLREGYNALVAHHGLARDTACIGLDARTMVTFDKHRANPLHMKSLVQQELIRHGVLWSGFHNLSFSHTKDDVQHLLRAYDEALGTLARALRESNVEAHLLGAPVEPVFRRTTRFDTKPQLVRPGA